MKKLIIAAALGVAALHAAAGTLLIGYNANGDTVHFTDSTSKYCNDLNRSHGGMPVWSYAEVIDARGVVQDRACWALMDDAVRLRWLTGESIWQVDKLTFTPYFDQAHKRK